MRTVGDLLDAAKASPHYDATIRAAVSRAERDRGASFAVYFDGETMFMRDGVAAPPVGSVCVCIAQWWSGGTVQVRYKGGHSEFVNV